MQLEQPVTWDNPDVKIFFNGVEQYTYDLTANTQYDLEITIHNSSREKPALGSRIDVKWVEFGAGGHIRHAISSHLIDVPVWPNVQVVHTTWRTPASPGHYCIEVDIDHPDDGNPSNNRGWNNTVVKAAASEVQVPIRIFNRWIGGLPKTTERLKNRTWWPIILWGVILLIAGLLAAYYSADKIEWWRWIYWPVLGLIIGVFAGYAVLGKPTKIPDGSPNDPQTDNLRFLVELNVDSYRFHDKTGKDADPEEIFAPKPPAWPAHVEPQTFYFKEDEAYRDVLLVVDAPDAARQAEIFNLNARQGGEPIGGATVTVTTKEED
jgi:hypothetical protein